MKGPVVYYPIAELYGTCIKDKAKAKDLHNAILDEIDAGLKVELDFKDVTSVSDAWMQHGLGLIAKDHGNDFFRDNVSIVNHEQLSKKAIKAIEKLMDSHQ